MKKNLCAGVAIVALLFFSSCGPSELTVASRPEQPYYLRPIAPGDDYVWIDGDWVPRSGHYHWREGYWKRAGSGVWISGSWENRRNGWYWRRGHWQ